ncbi:MAG TPA: c-type cytochrome [Phototrophicaceae bacterium]|nr:c-type cytochrome [Phototrophicaceae bacterium]
MPGTRRWFIIGLSLALLFVIAVPALNGFFAPPVVPGDATAGFALWQADDCAGCHTLDGIGVPYAADLTRIYAAHGETDLRAFLAAPDVPHPALHAAQIDDLIALLRSVSAQAAPLPTPFLHLSGGA